MVDAIATILTGAGASVTEGRDDDEWRKRVTAKLRQVPTILLIDNLRLKLDSSAVAAALAAPFWEDRILGQSEMARLPIRCLWIATGNNPEFSNEMARRLVRIRLDANVERPWQRSDFRHPDLMTWVRANRAWSTPASRSARRGSPRAGRADAHHRQLRELGAGPRRRARGRRHRRLPRQPREMMRRPTARPRGASVAAWWDRFGTAAVGTSDLFDVALRCDPSPPISGHTDRAQKTSFGISIKKMRDRMFTVRGLRLRLTIAGKAHQAVRWELRVCAEGSESTVECPAVGDLWPGGEPRSARFPGPRL